MEFFDKLGKKASEAYKVTADKTGKIAKEAKIRLKMGELKSQINEMYEEIGKKVYQNHVNKDTINLEKELEEECTRIDLLSAEIEAKLKECLELRDKKQCPKCFTEMDKGVKFCPECGEKQEEMQAREVEVIEKEDGTEEKTDPATEILEDIEKQEVEETPEVEVIANKEENEDLDESVKSDEEQEKEYTENLKKTIEVESNVKEQEEKEEEEENKEE